MSKAIKDKMDKLNTLSGGIVFGKEDAWERLQGKLDQKPVRRMPLGYKIATAAAAILAVMICISVLYNNDQQIVAAIATQPQPAPPINKTIQPGSNSIEVIANAPTTEKKLNKTINATKDEATPIVTREVAQQNTAANEPAPLSESSAGIITGIPIKDEIAIVQAPKPKMRVVHINEMEDDVPAGKQTYASNGSGSQKMKVISINEEAVMQREVIIERNNRPRGKLPFFIPATTTAAATENTVLIAHNPFNIKLSIPN